MANESSITFSYQFLANGYFTGNPGDANNPARAVATNQPFNSTFSDGMGGTITASDNATVRLTYRNNDVVDQDVNGDGTTEPTLGNGTRIQLFEVDLDGDGIYESEIRGQNPNDLDLHENNQTGANLAYFNATLKIYVNGSNTGQSFSSGHLMMSNSAPFGDNGSLGDVSVDYDGENFVIGGDPGYPLFPSPVVCFAAGTLILTATGLRPVESLGEGDLVVTSDNGLQPIRWIGRKTVLPEEQWKNPNYRPIRIAPGALGHGYPELTLRVSAQHRIMICSPVAELLFGSCEVLVPAIGLLGCDGVAFEDGDKTVHYYHFLLDRHEVVQANGLAAESLFAGQAAHLLLGNRLPGIVFGDCAPMESHTARPCLKSWETRALISNVRDIALSLGLPFDVSPQQDDVPEILIA